MPEDPVSAGIPPKIPKEGAPSECSQRKGTCRGSDRQEPDWKNRTQLQSRTNPQA